MNSFPPIRLSTAAAGGAGAACAVFLGYLFLPPLASACFPVALRGETGMLFAIVLQPPLALAVALGVRRFFRAPAYTITPLPKGRIAHLAWALPLMMLAVGLCGAGWKEILDACGIAYGTPPTERLIGEASPALLLVFFLTAVFLVPVVEEVLFRDLLYEGLRAETGAAAAATISALVFALLHNTLLQVVPLFLMALLLQLARAKARSLLFPIALHACSNLISFGVICWRLRW